MIGQCGAFNSTSRYQSKAKLWRQIMWKILVGFILFAAVALFVIVKGGDSLDMQGEAGAHSSSSDHSAPATPATPPAAPAAAPSTAPAESK
jgi:hypothetical protein